MIEHFENMRTLYSSASVQIPNSIFKTLSSSIKGKNGRTNIQQVAFAYCYLVSISFLYKYSYYVDVDNDMYVQNADIKELLGYNRTTKSIDHVIKKNGILDNIGLTETTKEYPILFEMDNSELINNIPLRRFSTINDLDSDNNYYKMLRKIVKNRNYEIKEPIFLTYKFDDNEYGTLYNYENTHQITLNEFLSLLLDGDIDNIDLLLCGFFKSKCKGLKNNMRSMSLNKIVKEIGIDKSTFYKHTNILKEKEYISINHKGWQTDLSNAELNEYFWKGIKKKTNNAI